MAWQYAVRWTGGAIIGNGVGSRSTRQADGQAFAAGLPVCLQSAKARQALPALLADISGFWQGRGLLPESALNQKVIKL